MNTVETTVIATLATGHLCPTRRPRDYLGMGWGKSLSTTSYTSSIVPSSLPQPATETSASPLTAAIAWGREEHCWMHNRARSSGYLPIHLPDEETEAQAHGAEAGVGIQVSLRPLYFLLYQLLNSPDLLKNLALSSVLHGAEKSQKLQVSADRETRTISFLKSY